MWNHSSYDSEKGEYYTSCYVFHTLTVFILLSVAIVAVKPTLSYELHRDVTIAQPGYQLDSNLYSTNVLTDPATLRGEECGGGIHNVMCRFKLGETSSYPGLTEILSHEEIDFVGAVSSLVF